MGKFDDLLAELRVKRERLALEVECVDRVIAALEEAATSAVASESAIAQSRSAVAAAQASVPAGVGPYSLLDIYEATQHFLSTAATPKSSTEIAAALRAGGFKTRSKNLVNTVRVMLRRKDARSTGISATKDGTRWFIIKRKEARRTKRASSAE